MLTTNCWWYVNQGDRSEPSHGSRNLIQGNFYMRCRLRPATAEILERLLDGLSVSTVMVQSAPVTVNVPPESMQRMPSSEMG